jgi:hypothetical protein
MAAITTSNLTSAIMKFIASQFLPALVSNLVIAPLINHDYEETLADSGDEVTIILPPIGAVANNIADGSNVQPQSLSPGNVKVTLNSHIEATFKVTDVTRALSSVNALDLYMQPMVIACAERVESDILGLFPELTFNAHAGATATSPDENAVDLCETTLFKSKTPALAPKFLVTSADAYAALRKVPRFTEFQTIGPQNAGGNAIVNGALGKIKDFFVFRSQLVQQTGAVGNVTTHNLAFTRDAFTFVSRKLAPPLPGTGAIAEYIEYAGYTFRVLISYDPQGMAQQVSIDCLYGCAVLRNQFGMELWS